MLATSLDVIGKGIVLHDNIFSTRPIDRGIGMQLLGADAAETRAIWRWMSFQRRVQVQEGLEFGPPDPP